MLKDPNLIPPRYVVSVAAALCAYLMIPAAVGASEGYYRFPRWRAIWSCFFEGASFALNGERVAVTARSRIALMGVRPLRRVAGARCNRRAPPSARH